MANFMGPMAPPQAAPQAPPQLDIRTNPSQRAQFKTFMQGMRPQPTTAPIAPMLPAPIPSPMDQIDIFAPVPMANGGVADPFAIEGKIGQSVGPRMVGGTTNVFQGSADNTGDDDSPNVLGITPSQFDFNSNPLLEAAKRFAPADMPPPAPPTSNMMQNAMNFAGGIMQGMQVPGPMGGMFSIRPVVQQGGLNDSLGIMANYSMPFEDGGPVRMQRGGRLAGGTTNLIDKSRPSGVSGDDPYDEFSGGGDQSGSGDDGGSSGPSENFEALNAALAAELRGMSQDFRREERPTDLAPDLMGGRSLGADSQLPPDLLTPYESGTPSIESIVARNQRTQQDVQNLLSSMDNIDEGAGDFAGISPVASGDLSALSEVERLIGPQPRDVGPVDPTIIDFINRNPQPPADSGVRTAPPPTSDPYGMPGDPDPALIQEQAFDRAIGNMFATPVTVKTARGNVTSTALDDLERRMGGNVDATGDKSSNMFGGLGKVVVDALLGVGRKKAEDIFTNIESGRPGVIDARTGQIQGYIGDNALGFGRAYSGRAGYDPFAIGADATFDPSRNAFIVNRQQENVGEDAQQRNRALPTAPPTDDAEPVATPPDPMIPPTRNPIFPAPTPNVVVPSTRTNVPVVVPSLLPDQGINPTFLPQSFLDLLASFNRPAPRAMQEGGAVLDKAADDFLEALKVA